DALGTLTRESVTVGDGLDRPPGESARLGVAVLPTIHGRNRDADPTREFLLRHGELPAEPSKRALRLFLGVHVAGPPLLRGGRPCGGSPSPSIVSTREPYSRLKVRTALQGDLSRRAVSEAEDRRGHPEPAVLAVDTRREDGVGRTVELARHAIELLDPGGGGIL